METKKLIMIIDDEPDLAETMKFFLEASNFRVIVSNSPEEGLDKVRINKPDLVLLDLMMPRMNGHEVCRRLKEDRETMYIPIIMLTCLDSTIDKVEALNLGVADYVCKDFPSEEILARIKAAIRGASSVGSPEETQEKNKKITELRKIIDEKNLRTLLQPIVKLSTRQPIGYEAFTYGPKGSILENPVNLFTFAASENMFPQLDFLALSLAAKRASPLLKDKILFLNTDPGVIDEEYFRNLHFLKGSALSPAQICIEITERTCVKDFNKLSNDIANLKNMGTKIAIDDVGEGYSSLKSIVALRPDFVKADISFVRNINTDEVKKSIMELITDLTQKINREVIAEGIETEDELKTLIQLKVEYGQGYLFARPFEQA